jgi:hypothetical protein
MKSLADILDEELKIQEFEKNPSLSNKIITKNGNLFGIACSGTILYQDYNGGYEE